MEGNGKPRPALNVPKELLDKLSGPLVAGCKVDLLQDFTPAFVETVAAGIGDKRS